jgi:hypothetical protein
MADLLGPRRSWVHHYVKTLLCFGKPLPNLCNVCMRESQSLKHTLAVRHVERFSLTGILESMGYAAKNLGPVGTLEEERPFLERSDRLLNQIDTGVALKWCLMALLTDIIPLIQILDELWSVEV